MHETEGLVGVFVVIGCSHSAEFSEIGEFGRHGRSCRHNDVGGSHRYHHGLLTIATRCQCFGGLKQPQRKGRFGRC